MIADCPRIMDETLSTDLENNRRKKQQKHLKNMNALQMMILGPCQEWTGSKNRDGYGINYRTKGSILVHRQIMGDPKGSIVMHLCDNPSCINKDHLKIGTPKQNSLDMVNKRRHSYGDKRPASKFTNGQIIRIRTQGKGNKTYKELANEYGCSETAIFFILKNKTYKDINCEYLKEFLDLPDGDVPQEDDGSDYRGCSGGNPRSSTS